MRQLPSISQSRRQDGICPRILDLRREALRLLGLGAHTQAEALFVRARSASAAVVGDDYPEAIEAVNDLAMCRVCAGRFAEAAADYSRLLGIAERLQGKESPDAVRIRQLTNCREQQR